MTEFIKTFSIIYTLFPFNFAASLVMLNCIYMKYVTKVQTFLTACKVACMVLIITLGAVVLVRGTCFLMA